ncbi:MAG: hypothetical protein HOP08_08070 [Cyclobacteriaceae bacterium]|nr:hypothetical protein [Cyclobacteriaceae bacterium]
MRVVLLFLFLSGALSLVAQQLVFPSQSGWTQLEEGKEFSFTVGLTDNSKVVRFSLDGGNDLGMQLDSIGHFTWTPSYDLVDRLAKQKEISVIFQAELKDGKRTRHAVNFFVTHVNRPPVVGDLPTFYVKQNTSSKYQIPADYVHDPDGDPVIFKARESVMPEGAVMTSLGQITWTPSRTQFNSLRTTPLDIEFIVQDQPDKAETIGKIRVGQTQLDLPPELLLVPADTLWTIKENEGINLKIYVSDPNGDDNIDQVDFISSNVKVPKSALKENSKVQREFTWSPGYDFVDEAEKKVEVLLTFFAFDKSSNRVQRKIRVIVIDAENIEEKDKILYQKYFNTLAATKNLIDLLDQNNEKLEGTFNRAKKGKKKRTILTASLGAVTGISPLVLNSDGSKGVSVVGGTSVLTLNSLEAGQVIGRSAGEYQNRIKTNRDLRTQLQLKGNFFARKYALKSIRRVSEFEFDRDELVRLLNTDQLTTLELSARPQGVPTEKELKKTFTDLGDEN